MQDVFLHLVHFLYGPHPEFELNVDDLIRLILAFVILMMLIGHLVGGLGQFFVKQWLVRRTRRKLVQLGTRLGFQSRPERDGFGPTMVATGIHGKLPVRFLACHWRGLPMMAVAASFPEPSKLWLQISPRLSRLWRWPLNVLTCRWQDLRSPEIKLRATPTGDPMFDEAYLVKSNQPDLVTKILHPEIRHDLMAVRQPFRNAPVITLTNGEARYARFVGGLTAIDPIADKLDLVCALAAAAEEPPRSRKALPPPPPPPAPFAYSPSEHTN